MTFRVSSIACTAHKTAVVLDDSWWIMRHMMRREYMTPWEKVTGVSHGDGTGLRGVRLGIKSLEGVCVYVAAPSTALAGHRGAALTCLELGRGVGAALAVVRDGVDVHHVLLAALEHGDVAAARG